MKAFCALLLGVLGFIFGVPPTNAQGAPESDPQKCAHINLAHYYLRCANVNNAILGLIQYGIKGSSQTKKETRDYAAAMEDLVNDFAEMSANLYQRAGKKLTKEALEARARADKKDIDAAVEVYLSGAKGPKPKADADSNPNHVVNLCAIPVLGHEIRDSDKLNARFLKFEHEARQLLAKQSSCLK
jgi:hypothetical protein